jgi:N-acetylmuramic acid 6-phosphate (MurNAc-6-P) etherase
MNREDEKVVRAVRGQLKAIAKAIELGAESLICGGRLFYEWAGTSGGLGMLGDEKEALAFALLADATLQGMASNVRGARGARRPAVPGKIIL